MSDNDSGGEVREKLRKASIEPNSAASKFTAADNDSAHAHSLHAKNNRTEEDKTLSDDENSSTYDDREVRNFARKRSRSEDEDEDEDEDKSISRTKKRVSSTNSSADEDKAKRATPTSDVHHVQALASPKGKRTREDFLRDNDSDDDGKEVFPESPKKTNDGDTDADEERTVKRKREASLVPDTSKTSEDAGNEAKSPIKLPSTSGFGNVSAASPFASIASPSKKEEAKPEASTTSKAAFEASSFSKLAQSNTSPFGSIGTSSSASPFGGFGGTASVSSFATASTKPLGFGGLGVGTFAAAATTEGSASPWASAAGKPSVFASGSSSFGKAPPITGLSNAPAKPFGAPQDEEDEDEEDDDEEGSDEEGSENDGDEEHEDEEAHVSHAKTVKAPAKSGEEEEFSVFLGRAKLYQFVGEWKECGAGTMKLNVLRFDDDPHDVGLETLFQELDDEEENLIVYPGGKPNGKAADPKSKEESESQRPKRKARFILRVDGSGRLVLNTALTASMPFGGDAKGSEPKGQTLLFHGTLAAGEDDTKSTGVKSLQLKMKADKALELWTAVEVVKKLL